jgi:hypothetical protein
MRHGEKLRGDLSPNGLRRAKYLPTYFRDFRPDGVPFPTHLIAMKSKHRSSSRRCIDTMIPMMREFSMSLNIEFTRENVTGLVNYIKSLPDDAVALVCWEHHWAVNIVRSLGFPVMDWNETPITDHVDSKAFDLLWKIDGNKFESFATFAIDDGRPSIYCHPLRQTYKNFQESIK